MAVLMLFFARILHEKYGSILGDKNLYSGWQWNSMAVVCIIIWLLLPEYYMNSMVLIVFYDSKSTNLYYVLLLWVMAFIQS